jgi:hypothetical protein
MRRRLTGASGRRISFGRLSSLPASSFQDDASRAPHPDSKATSRRTWLSGTVSVGRRKLKLRRAAAKLPSATRLRPIAGGRVSNVVNKFRSGAELLSFSVTAGRRGIQRKSPPNLTNGQETGKIFQRKMFHVVTVFFASFGVSCSTPSVCASPLRSKTPNQRKEFFPCSKPATTCIRVGPDCRNAGRFGRAEEGRTTARRVPYASPKRRVICPTRTARKTTTA